MSWVIRRDPDLPENQRMSPWRGCLHIINNKGWFATDLAKPTQFEAKQEALEMMHRLSRENPESKYCLGVYEEVFQKEIKEALPPPPPPTVVTPNWDWGPGPSDDDIPF